MTVIDLVRNWNVYPNKLTFDTETLVSTSASMSQDQKDFERNEASMVT